MSAYSYASARLSENLYRKEQKISRVTWRCSCFVIMFSLVCCAFRVGCFFASERARESTLSLLVELRETENSLRKLQVSLEQERTPVVIAQWAGRNRFVPAFEVQYASPDL